MSQVVESAASFWTAIDLVERFGAIPLDRIRRDPAPGTATEQNVIELNDHESRLYELVDGTLVEKTVGFYESSLAGRLVVLLGSFVLKHHLGIVLPADGMMRLAPGLVRMPDVSFLSWQRLPGGKLPRDPIPDLAPDLAIEVISKSNTRQEMDRKLHDYFMAGVRLVWYVYHSPRCEVCAYTSPNEYAVLREDQTLDGGEVVPGFRLALGELFAELAAPENR
jgi:Uma2 family endonuclease